jgi:hypothetical protein
MNAKLFKIGVLTMLVVGVITSGVWAAKALINERVIQGTVEVTRDMEGEITAVKLVVNDKISYPVTLDEKGKEMGENMAGKKVEVTGTVETKDKVEWLTVQSYRGVYGYQTGK